MDFFFLPTWKSFTFYVEEVKLIKSFPFVIFVILNWDLKIVLTLIRAFFLVIKGDRHRSFNQTYLSMS